MTPFFGNSPYDIEDEAKWIECLVELIKGHNDYAEVSKKLKLRKDNLKKQVNMVIIGHVDAGKSTLMGHLLYKFGVIDASRIHKN